MKIRYFTLIYLISGLLPVFAQSENPFPRKYFSPPIDFQIYLAANFGEIRTDHFHSGLDIKTKARSGEPIYSVADGYVIRISISPGGFGHALYINHPNGYTTVYGHLSHFNPKIEAYIRDRQYAKKSFQITDFPKPGQFPVKRGQIIGYSGNSGSSTGPHLHFEIRQTASEHPTNPLLYGFNIPDHLAPVIKSLRIYPLGTNSFINEDKKPIVYKTVGTGGNFHLVTDSVTSVAGPFGIGIETFDRLDGVPNKCAIYTIDLVVDGHTVSSFRMDEFAFSETRYVNSYIDYAARLKEGITIRKTWIDPNNRLRCFPQLLNRGIVAFNDNQLHEIELIVKDSYGNSSTLSFQVRSVVNPIQKTPEPKEDYLMVMPYQQANAFKIDGFEINLPAFALYDSLKFRLMILPPVKGIYSKIYKVHDPYTPVHKNYILRIKPSGLPVGFESKALLAAYGKDKNFIAKGGTWKNGLVELKTREFGTFFVVIDTAAPKIHPQNFMSNHDWSGKKSFRFTVTDDLSGIASYEGTIDGKWALFEYDPKNDRLFYVPDETRIGKNKEHEIVLKVADNKENEMVFRRQFFW